MDYEQLRHFADSWGLVLLLAVFAVFMAFLFRRGSGERYRRAAEIPLKADEHRPSDETRSPAAAKQDEGGSQDAS